MLNRIFHTKTRCDGEIIIAMNKNDMFGKINKLLNKITQSKLDSKFVNTTLPKRETSTQHHSKTKVDDSNKVRQENNSKILSSSYVKVLMYLYINGKYVMTYDTRDDDSSFINHSEYSICRSLFDLKFIKINTQEPGKCTFILTPIGQEYIKENLPHLKDFYQKYSKVKRIPKLISQLGLILLLLMIGLNVFPVLFNNVISFVVSVVGTYISIMLILYSSSVNSLKSSQKIFKKLNYRKAFSQATPKSFLKFLKKHHIQEINVHFDYNDDYPKIHTVMFK